MGTSVGVKLSKFGNFSILLTVFLLGVGRSLIIHSSCKRREVEACQGALVCQQEANMRQVGEEK